MAEPLRAVGSNFMVDSTDIDVGSDRCRVLGTRELTMVSTLELLDDILYSWVNRIAGPEISPSARNILEQMADWLLRWSGRTDFEPCQAD